MSLQCILMLSMVMLTCTADSTSCNEYFVKPDYDGDNSENAHTLLYYVNNSDKYFTSCTQIWFKPGQYYLATHVFLRNVNDIAFTGISTCNITFAALARVSAYNSSNVKFENITFMSNNDTLEAHSKYKGEKWRFSNYSGLIILLNCESVTFVNIHIIINAQVNGIVAVNTRSYSAIRNITITIQNTCKAHGIQIFYNNILNETRRKYTFYLTNFKYSTAQNKTCITVYNYAMMIRLEQKSYTVHIIVQNALFHKLTNSAVLLYKGYACGNDSENIFHFNNVTILQNIGNTHYAMINITLHTCGYTKQLDFHVWMYHTPQYNLISFNNCSFRNNTNISSMISILPTSSRTITGFVIISNSEFCYNKNVHFINVHRSQEIMWQLTSHIVINHTLIMSNIHESGDGLISIINGVIELSESVQITSNQYYENIIELHRSALYCNGKISLLKNKARFILRAKAMSYFTLSENTFVNMSFNTVYKVAVQDRNYNIKTAKPICPIQFVGDFHKTSLILMIAVYDNVHMTSKDLPGEDKSFGNCSWLAGSLIDKYTAAFVYNKTIDFANLVFQEVTTRPIPLSVCPCSKYDNKVESNCSFPYLGKISPGKTLLVNLMVSKQWLKQKSLSDTTLIVGKSLDDNICDVTDVSQLSQTHDNVQDCNEYKYTLWPRNEASKICKLFLGLDSMPEMFFVQLNNCPVGFVLQKSKKACDCDPVLASGPLLINSCNLDNETIQRPAYSWVSSVAKNGSFSYSVSPSCPSDYCLPHLSHLKLSNPDLQCQFNRSGVLCGQCQHGLSAVFGSSRCLRCSNVYLLTIIPLAIAGISLVLVLFVFNFTIINGTINTFIFYVNILSINMFILFPSCKLQVTCTLISLFNLDLGFTICFYNGMDDYAKAWLQLIFPSYMLTIAFLLIITSRYCTRVQRLTARRALPVLATLFLLSYTKVLQTACKILFSYAKITHLSYGTTEYVWSTDTTVPLFGLKFMIIFVVSLVIFFILLPFNIVLLCTRKFSYFKLVTTFKPLLDTYFSSYKDKVSYWTGLQLIVRAMILALSGFLKNTRLLVNVVLLCVLLSAQGILRPFKNKFNNIQESLLLLNLLIVHLASLHKDASVGLTVAQITVAIGLVYLIMAVAYHCVMFKWRDIIVRSINTSCLIAKIKQMKKRSTLKSVMMDDFRSRIADVTYNYKEFRDSLIGYEQ